MRQNLYRDLAKIKAQIEELEAKQAQIRLSIIEGMEASGDMQVVNQYGKVTISQRAKYTYSEKINALEGKVKLAKIKEQQSGAAKATYTTVLIFTPAE